MVTGRWSTTHPSHDHRRVPAAQPDPGLAPPHQRLPRPAAVNQLLDTAVAGDPRARLAPATVLGVALHSIVEARVLLYALSEWGADLLTEDRVGRALERPFDTDRGHSSTATPRWGDERRRPGTRER
jgi:hypothetical protein